MTILKYRFTDERSVAHEFEASEPGDFIINLMAFREMALANYPKTLRPFHAHLHVWHKTGWQQIKQFGHYLPWLPLGIGGRELPDFRLVPELAQKTLDYADKLEIFCHEIVNDIGKWSRLEDYKNAH